MSSTTSKAIRIALIRKGLRQRDICKYFGYTRSYVSEICNGKKELKTSKLELMAVELFEIPFSTFIKWGEE